MQYQDVSSEALLMGDAVSKENKAMHKKLMIHVHKELMVVYAESRIRHLLHRLCMVELKGVHSGYCSNSIVKNKDVLAQLKNVYSPCCPLCRLRNNASKVMRKLGSDMISAHKYPLSDHYQQICSSCVGLENTRGESVVEFSKALEKFLGFTLKSCSLTYMVCGDDMQQLKIKLLLGLACLCNIAFNATMSFASDSIDSINYDLLVLWMMYHDLSRPVWDKIALCAPVLDLDCKSIRNASNLECCLNEVKSHLEVLAYYDLSLDLDDNQFKFLLLEESISLKLKYAVIGDRLDSIIRNNELFMPIKNQMEEYFEDKAKHRLMCARYCDELKRTIYPKSPDSPTAVADCPKRDSRVCMYDYFIGGIKKVIRSPTRPKKTEQSKLDLKKQSQINHSQINQR